MTNLSETFLLERLGFVQSNFVVHSMKWDLILWVLNVIRTVFVFCINTVNMI